MEGNVHARRSEPARGEEIASSAKALLNSIARIIDCLPVRPKYGRIPMAQKIAHFLAAFQMLPSQRERVFAVRSARASTRPPRGPPATPPPAAEPAAPVSSIKAPKANEKSHVDKPDRPRRPLLDERETRFGLRSHQALDRLGGRDLVVGDHRDLKQRALGGIHRRIAQVAHRHLAKTLETADLDG